MSGSIKAPCACTDAMRHIDASLTDRTFEWMSAGSIDIA